MEVWHPATGDCDLESAEYVVCCPFFFVCVFELLHAEDLVCKDPESMSN